MASQTWRTARITDHRDSYHREVLISVDDARDTPPEVWSRVDAHLRAEIVRRLLSWTWYGAGPTLPPPPEQAPPALTVEAVMATYDRLWSLPPVIIEIWCVDRPHEYWRLYEARQDMHALAGAFGSRPPQLCGIPLYEWYNHLPAHEDDRPPPFADEPGVYLVLSNGNYIRIGE